MPSAAANDALCWLYGYYYTRDLIGYITEQDAQLLQRDRAAGCVSFGQKWKTGTVKQYFTDIWCVFNHCEIIGL